MPQPKKKTEADAAPAARARKAEFPKIGLEDALDVPRALQRNGGQPLPAIDTATAVKRSPGSSGFRTLTASASAYGLITGSYKTTFTMRDLGAAITQPKSSEEAAVALVTAALTPGTFREIYDYYKGKKFPERQFFENTVVREFGVDPKQAGTCCDVFEANVRFVGLIRQTPGGDWLSTEAAPPAGTTVMTREEIDEVEEQAAEVEAGTDALTAEDIAAAARIAEVSVQPPAPADRPNRKVFISHGKNKKVVAQLKELLVYGEFEPVVSVERETTSKPVPDKVMDDMRACGAGIIHVGTERTVKDETGDEHHFLNQNVLIEIGAAMALYKGRFILLVEKGTQLPSNLQGLYEVRFEGEGLDHDATMKLLKAFNEFKT